MKPFPEPGQKPAGRRKQQHIARKIQKTVAAHIGIGRVLQHIPVVFDGAKGNEVGILPQQLFVGDLQIPAVGTVE